ncbi:hypothetical protein LIER_23608 [Lithospermum erythrorhizon]|uniref:Uncharacterized protein n=1 Tax=Lithospermum erythrorhizon TaxID=34254 RepID=A0AAV3QY39_LITER
MTGGYQTQSPVPDPLVELDADFEGNIIQRNSTFLHRHSFHSSSRSMILINTDILYGRKSTCQDTQDTVWNLKVSSVGRGLMGYLGNKGSISTSMSLQFAPNKLLLCVQSFNIWRKGGR